ncbi:MAG: RtcB family protein [Myxococcales bacterium]|nr:RtcB family protein [Myxococcales bacterium]
MSRQDRKKKQKKLAKEEARAALRAHVPHAQRPWRSPVPLEPIDEVRWRIPQRGAMRTHGVVYADESLLPDLREDASLEQVANVATLPGIVGPSMAMPDIHWGYGFPIGGVAAFDLDEGVVSPGGVGYDINCGVRLLASDVDVEGARLESTSKGLERTRKLVDDLFAAIPSGVGERSDERIGGDVLRGILEGGLPFARTLGWATDDDVAHVEENGVIRGARADAISSRARMRGGPQLGTLGSGNHFAEIGVVDQVYDPEAAEAFGLRLGQITLMIHSGSRGLGHQVCVDAITEMLRAAAKYDIPLVDRQLCCAPVRSVEGHEYLEAMAAAANFAFANRQLMTNKARDVFERRLGAELRTVYDVCHNIAKIEEHVVDGAPKEILVHRKGATRALPKDHPLVPEAYRAVGQPVIIPGDMGRYSFVLKGEAGSAETFGSACHGAGRVLSRGEAKRRFERSDVSKALEDRGVIVRGASKETIVEEMPQAYKDVADVVDVVARGGIASKVARIRPIGCVKG